MAGSSVIRGGVAAVCEIRGGGAGMDQVDMCCPLTAVVLDVANNLLPSPLVNLSVALALHNHPDGEIRPKNAARIPRRSPRTHKRASDDKGSGNL